jgi:hypothetical protein
MKVISLLNEFMNDEHDQLAESVEMKAINDLNELKRDEGDQSVTIF